MEAIVGLVGFLLNSLIEPMPRPKVMSQVVPTTSLRSSHSIAARDWSWSLRQSLWANELGAFLTDTAAEARNR